MSQDLKRSTLPRRWEIVLKLERTGSIQSSHGKQLPADFDDGALWGNLTSITAPGENYPQSPASSNVVIPCECIQRISGCVIHRITFCNFSVSCSVPILRRLTAYTTLGLWDVTPRAASNMRTLSLRYLDTSISCILVILVPPRHMDQFLSGSLRYQVLTPRLNLDPCGGWRGLLLP